ncbi:unnamed protein product [Arctogadus glacialis]
MKTPFSHTLRLFHYPALSGSSSTEPALSSTMKLCSGRYSLSSPRPQRVPWRSAVPITKQCRSLDCPMPTRGPELPTVEPTRDGVPVGTLLCSSMASSPPFSSSLPLISQGSSA